jgi:energy-coupling factor transport system ATP-binding protein
LTAEPAIQTLDLCYSYPGEPPVLSNVNLNIEPGEFVAIIGSNGSGKTTLVKHFNGLLKPSQGRVLINGLDTSKTRVSELARRVGFVFQNPDHQIFAYSVWEEAAFGLKLQTSDANAIEKQTNEALNAVSLYEYRERHPRALSRGQRQRLATASILSLKTPILVLDEPTTGQDFVARRQLMDLAIDLHSQGRTIVVITHDMALVAEYATRVIVLKDGQVILDSDSKEAFRRADILKAAGLNLPPAMEIARGLQAYGLSVSPSTQQELVEALLAALKR